MNTTNIPLAPEYLLKPYSQLDKNNFKTMLNYYYEDYNQGDIIKFYYQVRGQDLTSNDLSLKEAFRLIDENKYEVYFYRNISRPDIYSLCRDVIFL